MKNGPSEHSDSDRANAKEFWKLDTDTYTSYREALVEKVHAAEKSYDNSVLTGAGGAVALSMTFLKDLCSPHKAVGPMCLFGAWICFGAAIFLILLNIRFSAWAHEKFIAILDDNASAIGSATRNMWAKIAEEQSKVRLTMWIDWLNIASAALLLIGIVMMAIFAFRNLQ